MRKTTIQLTDEQYFYLKEKVLALQKKKRPVSMVSIIRGLVDKDMKLFHKKSSQGSSEHVVRTI